MTTENLSTLKINVLKSQEQYNTADTNGKIKPNELYLIPNDYKAPIKGEDYWTDDDKAEIIQQVISYFEIAENLEI